MNIEIGTGVLNWPANERRSDRYGLIGLLPDVASSEFLKLDIGAIAGRRGKLIAQVVEARQSTHIGDLFRAIFPSTPDVGEEIELGEGILFSHGTYVGVYPRDTTQGDWMDPRKLYRAHEQTVRLVFQIRSN